MMHHHASILSFLDDLDGVKSENSARKSLWRRKRRSSPIKVSFWAKYVFHTKIYVFAPESCFLSAFLCYSTAPRIPPGLSMGTAVWDGSLHLVSFLQFFYCFSRLFWSLDAPWATILAHFGAWMSLCWSFWCHFLIWRCLGWSLWHHFDSWRILGRPF